MKLQMLCVFCLVALPAHAHEVWLQPVQFVCSADETIDINMKVNDGKTVRDSNDRYKIERSLARIEQQYGLRQVNLKKSARPRSPTSRTQRRQPCQATSPYPSTSRRKECNPPKHQNHHPLWQRSCRSR